MIFNPLILRDTVQQFINENSNIDVTKLILKGSPFKDIKVQELALQIGGKQKCKQKLPTWFSNKNIYYPHNINIEQTSSEVTAKYKASIISGKSSRGSVTNEMIPPIKINLSLKASS